MWQQIEFSLKEHRRGFHIVTGEIIGKLPMKNTFKKAPKDLSLTSVIRFHRGYRTQLKASIP